MRSSYLRSQSDTLPLTDLAEPHLEKRTRLGIGPHSSGNITVDAYERTILIAVQDHGETVNLCVLCVLQWVNPQSNHGQSVC